MVEEKVQPSIKAKDRNCHAAPPSPMRSLQMLLALTGSHLLYTQYYIASTK